MTRKKKNSSGTRTGRRRTLSGRGSRRKGNVLSVPKTAALSVVIIAACFILLFITTTRNSDGGGGRERTAAQKTPSEVTRSSSLSGKENTPAVSLPAVPSSTVPLSAAPSVQKEQTPSAADEPRSAVPVTGKTAEQRAERLPAPAGSRSAVQSAERVPRVSAALEGKKTVHDSVSAAALRQETKRSPDTQSAAQQEKRGGIPALPEIPPAVHNAKLVFVFDDAGQNLNQLEKFVTLPFPVTVSVLPKLPHSKACADRVRKSGNEVMLHQPMQAVNKDVNPGPGAVTPGMQPSQIDLLVRQNIAEIGPVAGVNNHEGSLISEDELRIGAVMQAAKESGAFFLDSRTTSQTRVPQASMELGIPYYERNIFLDNSRNRQEIIGEIMRGLNIANSKGAVIMIGHVWAADVLPGILIELYPVLRSKGYVFTTVTGSGAVIKP